MVDSIDFGPGLFVGRDYFHQQSKFSVYQWGAQVLSRFKFMQKFRFQYQLEGKGLENNFDPSVKL